MRRRVQAVPIPRPQSGIGIGVTMTRLPRPGATAAGACPPMNIVRNISGPNNTGALPGTESGLSGDYVFTMDGIITGDVLEWRGEDGGSYPNFVTVTLVSASENMAVINLVVEESVGSAFIFCTVNGVEFVISVVIEAIT